MKLLLAVLALISAGPVAADCPKAADWARAFYSEHYSFYADPSDRVLQFTTPEFGALLKREWEYSNGEIGHLDYDPWLGGQDGEIGKPVRFSVETESPDTAIVSMSYPFVLDSKHPPERHTVHLILRKREHECWQLQDFITPRGDSLSLVRVPKDLARRLNVTLGTPICSADADSASTHSTVAFLYATARLVTRL